jgi:type IV pilus assembly protein PilO
MSPLAQTRRRFKTLAQALGIIAIVAAALVLLPIRPSAEEKITELNEARLQVKAAEADVAPLRGLPEKLIKARGDIASFYRDRFPNRFSALPETLGALATQHDVKLSDVKYEVMETEEIAGLRRVKMQAVLSGDYAQVMGFINEVERSRLFILIDGVSLAEEGGGSGGTVRLQIEMTSLLHGFPVPKSSAPQATGGRS